MPPRARRRRGYIEQLPSGSWRAVAYVGLDPLTKEDVRLRKTRGDAEKALLKLGVRITGDTYVFSAAPDYSQPRRPRSVTQKYRLGRRQRRALRARDR